MQFTVMPVGPELHAVWRVKPMRPAFEAVYAWMPVRLTLRPAPEEMRDDPAEAALLHGGGDGTHAVERTAQVGVHHRVPFDVGDVLNGRMGLAAHSSCRVHEDVQRPQRPQVGDSGCSVSEIDVRTVDPVHRSTVRLQEIGDRTPDPLGCAGDDSCSPG